MEVLIPNCTASFFSLSLSTTKPYDDDDDDDDGCYCCLYFLHIILTHLLHSHIHCDLHHSCSTLTQHDLHLLLYPRKPHLPQTSIEGNSPPTHTHSWQHYSFQISRQLSNLPPSFQTYRRRGGRSRDQKSGGGNFTLGKIFTSPGPDPSLYYWRSACGLLASRLHNQRRCLLRHTSKIASRDPE